MERERQKGGKGGSAMNTIFCVPACAAIASKKTEPSSVPPAVMKHKTVEVAVATKVTCFVSHASGTVCSEEMSTPAHPPILTVKARDG